MNGSSGSGLSFTVIAIIGVCVAGIITAISIATVALQRADENRGGSVGPPGPPGPGGSYPVSDSLFRVMSGTDPATLFSLNLAGSAGNTIEFRFDASYPKVIDFPDVSLPLNAPYPNPAVVYISGEQNIAHKTLLAPICQRIQTVGLNPTFSGSNSGCMTGFQVSLPSNTTSGVIMVSSIDTTMGLYSIILAFNLSEGQPISPNSVILTPMHAELTTRGPYYLQMFSDSGFTVVQEVTTPFTAVTSGPVALFSYLVV